MAGPLLEIAGLCAGYDMSRVLQHVDLTVETHEVHVLLGRNGAGKTTLLRAIAGLAPPTTTAGTITLKGRNLVGMASHTVARAGVSLVHQGRRLFPSLTVQENIEIAARPGRWTEKSVYELFPRLAERRSQRSGTLSGGEQQMVAIARALVTNPQLLLLDEPTEGLAPIVVATILDTVRTLKDAGQTVLLAEQSVDFALEVADRVSILGDGGSVAWTGSPAQLRANPGTLSSLVGLGDAIEHEEREQQ